MASTMNDEKNPSGRKTLLGITVNKWVYSIILHVLAFGTIITVLVLLLLYGNI